MCTFILGNLWETTVQVRYLRHSNVGKAGTSSDEGRATYRSIKAAESLQSPQDHKELIGGGQQLKRGAIRSRIFSQQGQSVSKTACWVSELWSRYALWFSGSWLYTVKVTRMCYSSCVAHTQQYFMEKEVLAFAQNSFQPGFWMWVQESAVYIACKTVRLNEFPCHETLPSQRIPRKAARMVSGTGHLPQKQWADIIGLTFHKSFWKPNPVLHCWSERHFVSVISNTADLIKFKTLHPNKIKTNISTNSPYKMS